MQFLRQYLSITRSTRTLTVPAMALLFGALLCVGVPASAIAGPRTLTLYNGQHQQMVRLVVAAFEKDTGIHVKVRSGESPQIATTIIREGKHTPADVFFGENSPELERLQDKGLLAPVKPSTLKQIPSRYSSAKGLWVGVLARQNVMTYNPHLIKPGALPKTVLALAAPRYKGKVAIAPTDSDFLPLVRAVAVKYGKNRALKWLRGLKHNAQLFQDDEGVAAAVEKGAVAIGDINNYYYYRLREELGTAHMVSKLHHSGKATSATSSISPALPCSSTRRIPSSRKNSWRSWSAKKHKPGWHKARLISSIRCGQASQPTRNSSPSINCSHRKSL